MLCHEQITEREYCNWYVKGVENDGANYLVRVGDELGLDCVEGVEVEGVG